MFTMCSIVVRPTVSCPLRSPSASIRGAKLDEKVRKLERRNARLENELRKAHLIIDVQGKVAGLLGISLDDGTNS